MSGPPYGSGPVSGKAARTLLQDTEITAAHAGMDVVSRAGHGRAGHTVSGPGQPASRGAGITRTATRGQRRVPGRSLQLHPSPAGKDRPVPNRPAEPDDAATLHPTTRWGGEDRIKTVEIVNIRIDQRQWRQGRFKRILAVIEAVAALNERSVFVEAIRNDNLYDYLKTVDYALWCLDERCLLREPELADHPTLASALAGPPAGVGKRLDDFPWPCMEIPEFIESPQCIEILPVKYIP